MKKILKRTAACIIFVLLAVSTLYYLNWLFRLKKLDGSYPVQMFYEQQENTIDVLCLGSSHTYTNINPAVLWDEHGMAAYDLAGSNQTFWNTYYYLKEALKYQSPELLVLDIYRAVETEEYQDEAKVAMNTFGLRISEDFAECMEVSLEDQDVVSDYILKYPVYHARYQEFRDTDFWLYNGDTNGKNYKGFNMNSISTTSYEDLPDVSGVTDIGEMTEKTEEYLIKIIELAETKKIPLLLVKSPYMAVSKEDKEIYNRVEQIAEDYGIRCIDFNEHFQEIGLDPLTDFAESSHLNYYGNEKYTKYLGDYISKFYQVTDRRGDETYASWEANSEFYRKQSENVDLIKSQTLPEYLKKMFANQKRYTICISVDGDYKSPTLNLEVLLGEYGLDPREDGVWVIENGEVIYRLEKDMEEDSFFYLDMGRDSLTVRTQVRYSKMIEDDYLVKEVASERAGCNSVKNGINILIYDNELDKIVDNMGADALEGYTINRP